MKILMSNSKDNIFLAPQYFKHFQKRGVPVKGFYPFTYSKNPAKKIIQRGINKFLPSYLSQKTNSDLLHLVDSYQPDLLLLFKGMSVFPKTLEVIAKRKIKLVNYNPDHPFQFEVKKRNKNIINSIPFFDLYLSYSHRILAQMAEQYPKTNTHRIPFGYSITPEEFEIIKTQKETVKLCFIGTADQQRKQFIQKIIEKGFPIDIYGNGWNRYNFRSTAVRIFSVIKGIDYYRTLRKYRIQLNLFRPQNIGSHNMRSFEVPAVGGIMLAPGSEEHQNYFRENQEAFFFDNDQDLFKKIRFLLSLSETEANYIRTSARERSIRDGYSYEHRGDQLIKILKELF